LLLLQNGAPLGCGNTSILHLAAKSDMSDLFYVLVHTTEGIGFLTMKDQEGNTPWDVAMQYGAVSVQKVIRDLEVEYEQAKKEAEEAAKAEEQAKLEQQEQQTETPETESSEIEEPPVESVQGGYYTEFYGG